MANKFTKTSDLTKDWTQMASFADSRSTHYTRMFLVWRSNWTLIGWKSLHFETNRIFTSSLEIV